MLRNRNFTLLWTAQIISTIGDMALSVAIPVTVYNATGSKSALGISFVVGTLPAFLFSLLGGVLADRRSQKQIMITADLVRMAAILLLLFAANAKHFGPRDLLLFYAVSFLVASFSCFFGPARFRFTRILVPQDQLMQANSLIFTGSQAAWLGGISIGGLLLAYFSPKSVFLFDALTFGISALLIGFIKVKPPAMPAKPKAPLTPAVVWEEAREGLVYIGGSPILRPALIMLLLVTLTSQVTNTLEFPFVRDLWHGDARQYVTLIWVGFLAAFLTGAAASGPLSSVPPARLLLVGFTIMGVTGLIFAGSTGIWIGGAMLFLSGAGNTIENIANMTLFQTSAPPHLQGRIIATVSLLQKAAIALGGLLTAAIGLYLPGSASLRPVFAAAAVIYLMAGALAWVTLGRFTAQDIRDAGAPEPEPTPDEPEPVHA